MGWLGCLVGLLLGYEEARTELAGRGIDSRQDTRTELVSRGVAYTEKAFRSAARSGDLEVVKLFVQASMSVHAATICGAVDSGDLEVVKYLVEQGVDVNAKCFSGGTTLHWATAYNRGLEMVKYLVEELELDVNARNNRGGTALHWAATMWSLGGSEVSG